MKHFSKTLLIFLSLLIIGNSEIGNSHTFICKYKNHNIEIQTNNYHREVCDGVIDAIRFFENLGYNDSLDLHVMIVNEVITKIEKSSKSYRVLGMYDAKKDIIKVTSFDSDYVRNRTAWLIDPNDYQSGIQITIDIWKSIITHETSHQIAHKIWSKRNPYYVQNGMFLGHGIQEFIAYRAQLTMLDEKIRKKIIDQYGDIVPLQFRENMNGIRHMIHPHRFGVQSYLTPEGDEWIKEVFDGEFVTFDQGM